MKSFLMFLFAVLCLQTASAAKKPVTPEVAASPPSAPAISSMAWSPDGSRLAFLEDEKIHLMDAATGERRVLAPLSEIESAAHEPPAPRRFEWRNRRVRESTLQWFPGGDRLLVKVKGDLFLVPADGGEWKQLTATSHDEADPRLSPDGRLISFRLDNELYAAAADTGKPRRLTHDATDTVWNARLDWVYPEELDIPTAQWWSPDSRQIAYLQFDVIRQQIYPHADLLHLPAIDEPQRFPRAGTPNADVRLGVVPAGGGKTRWLATIDGDDELVARVAWLPDSSAVAVQLLNRAQNRLEVRILPLEGQPRTLLVEEDPHWINVTDDWRFLERSAHLLWSSERTGFRHLYLYSLDGDLEARITSGEWEVSAVAGVDERAGRVCFTATEASPLERQLYCAALDGGQELHRLTGQSGLHAVSMSPDAKRYVDSFSSRAAPPRKTLCDLSGSEVAVVQAPDRRAAGEYELLPVELLTVNDDEGRTFYARLIRPAGFEQGKKYPAVVLVYGGPGAQAVRDVWGGADLGQALAHAGFAVWQLDNRGSAGRGHQWETAHYRRFGEVETEDQVAGVRHLLKMGFVDPERVGVHGWSYGGYMTLNCLLRAPEVFAAGVAGAPVTDYRNYDTIYTERYLGLPQDNEEGYAASNVIPLAGRLEGELMIIHNFQDDNVLFQNTLRMAEALQEAGKPFSMMIYPQKTHGVEGDARKHLYRAIVSFFERALRP